MCVVVATWTVEQVTSLAKDIGLDKEDCAKLVAGKVNGKALLSLIQSDKLVLVIPPRPASLLADVVTQSSNGTLCVRRNNPYYFP
jgi:hypothetical protein